jgi:hypothetical protein
VSALRIWAQERLYVLAALGILAIALVILVAVSLATGH